MANIRGKYNATAPSLQDGQWTDIQVDARGGLKTSGSAYDSTLVTLSTDTLEYTAGDVLADTQEVANFFAASGDSKTLLNVMVIDNADQGAAIDLFFFDSDVVFGTENAAPTIADADLGNLLGVVQISTGDWVDLGTSRVAMIKGVNLNLVGANTSLYVAATVGGTATYGASDIIVKLFTAE